MKYLSIMMTAILLTACNSTTDPFGSNPGLASDWLIDEDFIRQGCFSGLDCIPSLDNPKFSAINGPNLEFLDDDDLVIGIWDGTNYVAYPHPILDWHEVANHNSYAVSYCPLTGSALHFSTDGEFGVSGLLYNSNLIMYDRSTNSYWPQMFLGSASGDRQGETLALKPLLETTWGNWKKLFPASIVANSNTGYNRNYRLYPYGSYKTCNSNSCADYLYFPMNGIDDRLPAKTRVLAIIAGNEADAYPIQRIPVPTVFKGNVGNRQYITIISGPDNIAIAFWTDRSFNIHTWDIETGTILLKDTESGSIWNILGRAIDGKAAGSKLTAAEAYIAYWFSVAAFNSTVELRQ